MLQHGQLRSTLGQHAHIHAGTCLHVLLFLFFSFLVKWSFSSSTHVAVPNIM